MSQNKIRPSIANLTIEEQDAIIIGCLNKHTKRGGTISNDLKIWNDEAIQIRRDIIIELLGKGLNHDKVVREMSNRWGVSRPTGYKYLKDACEYLSEGSQELKEHYAEVAQTRITAILEKCIEGNNNRLALASLDMLNRIQGLYTSKIEAEVKQDTTIEFKFGGE